MYVLKELSSHIYAYLVLLVVLGVHAAAFLYWADTRFEQQLLILLLTISYFIWGVLAHVKTAQITRHVVLEYLGIATLGGLLLLLLTF